jgi:hypothetical protein
MTEQVGDGLDRRTSFEQPRSDGVPYRVRTDHRGSNARALIINLECCPEMIIHPERPPRTPDGEKNLIKRCWASVAAQVGKERLGHGFLQRELERLTTFAGCEGDGLLMPVNIVPPERRNLADPHAISGDKQEHRIITPPHCGAPIGRFEQPLHLFPRQTARQMSQPPRGEYRHRAD